MKKLLSVLVAFCMVFSFAACAKPEEISCTHEWESKLEGDTVTLTCKLCGEAAVGKVDVPEKIVEKEVVKEVEVEKEVVKTVEKEVIKEVEVPKYLTEEERLTAEDYNLLVYYINNYSKLDAIKGYVSENFYTDISDDKLMEGAYKGLVGALDDPFSVYNSADESESYADALSQSYSGIGVMIFLGEDGNAYIQSITPNSPAEEAGLKAGDMIIAVDGVYYVGQGIDPVATAIRGEVGTKVTVEVIRNSEAHSFTCTRRKVGTQTVSASIFDDGRGYIAISGFDGVTFDEMKQALSGFEKQGIKKFVLDLRNNGGGDVDVAIKVADLLMGEGTMVYTKDRAGKISYYKTTAGRTSMKYVVLCNENTASAAEMLCAGIQDNNEAKLVGTTTYGKGIVQIFGYLTDGSSISLTQMQYFSPNGKTIHKVGVKPDYEVKLNAGAEEDAQLIKALEVLGK